MATFETPSYYISDNQVASNSVRAAIMKANVDETMDYAKGIEQIDVTSVAFGQATGDHFQEALSTEIQTYLRNTIALSVGNELYTSYMYMNTNMTSQEEQIGEMSDKARNHIMKYRQKYLLKLYDIKYYVFVRVILTYAIFFIGLFGILLAFSFKQEPPLLQSNITFIIIGVLTILYLIAVFLYIRNNSSRKKTDWDKYYFSSYGVNKNTSCNT
jgi:hypothetical protein